MPDYIFNNTVLTQDDIEEIASIKGYTLDELFEKNPDIKQTDPNEEGKETPSQETESAAVEESVALEPTVTDSSLGNGFSEFQVKDISIDLEDPKKRKELGFTYGEEQKYLRNKDVPARLTEQTTSPSILKSLLSQTARGFVRTAKGFEDFNNMIALNLASLDNPKLTAEDKKEMKAFLDSGGLKSLAAGVAPMVGLLPSSNNYKKVMETLSEGVRKFEDESITKAIEAGNYTAATELAVGGALESIPSILAAATGYGGLAMLGTSVAGNKFSEEFDANPQEALGTLTLNATGTGVTEAAFELFTRGLLKKAGVIKTKTGVEAAKKFVKEGMETWLKRTGLKTARTAGGIVGEAISEGATEAVNIINDNLILDKELDLNSAEAWYQIGDGAIIGALMGGGVTSLGQLGNSSSAIRNRAETILAPIDVKRKYESAAIELSELAFDLNKTESAEGKKIILDQINTIETNITIAKAEVSRGLNSLTKEELSEYASNQEQIFQAEKVFKTDDPDSVKKLAKKQIEELQQKNYDLFTAGAQRALETEIETVSQVIKPEDIDVVKNIEEFKTKYPKIDPKVDAFIQEDGKIVINKERAAEVGAVKAGSHELLHKILRSELSNETAAQKLIEDFKSTLTDKELRIVQKRIDDNYKYKRDAEGNIIGENALKDYNEEYLTAFSDAIGKGEIKFEEDMFTKIGNFISNIFKPKGYKKLNFTTGQNVYDFIKDYQKNIAKGKVIVEPKDIEGIIRESRSEEASNKVQEIYEQKGINGALDIIEQFKPITNKIVDQRKNAPGFDKQLLTDEIETGAGGILDLIQAYDPASNVPLAAYINKYLPVRSITASRRVLGEEFTDDITESVQVAAEAAPETEIEVAETKPTERLIETKNKFLSPEGRTAFEENIASRINELAPDEFTFKKLPNWGKEDLAKELNIPLKKFEGSSNFTQAELGRLLTWIETNVSDIRRALPGAAVLEGASVPESLIGTATGVPNNLLKNINLYERLARGTKDAGLVPYRKLKGIDNSSILKAVNIVDGRQMAGPRDKAAQTAKGIFNMMAKVMTNQEIRKQLQAKPRPDITTKETESARAGGIESRLLFSRSAELQTLNSLNIGGDNNNLLSVKYSKSSRNAYEKILISKRPELRDASEQVDNLFKWVDTLDIPENKKSKHEKLALFYMGNGNLILPEDGYKVEDAIKVAAKNKLDPFSYKNPNELLEKFAGDISPKKINPDNLSTFSNKQELVDGITTYEIEDSRAGQSDVRKIIDSNWGKKANPWCLAALIDGNLDQAWDYWKRYSGKKQIAFQNNKLLAFNAFDQYNPLADPRWYDRMDKATEGLVFYKKINDPRGLKLKLELNTKNNSTKQIGYEVGSPESNFYQEYNVDKELITEVKRTATKETFFNDTLKSNAVEEWKDGDEGAKFDLVFYTPIENGVLEEDPIDFEDAYSDLRFWDKRTAILTVDPSTKKDRYGNRKSTNSKHIYESVNPKQKYIVQAKAGGEFGYIVEYKELNGVKFLTGRDILNNYVMPDKEVPSEQLEFAKNLESVSKLIGTTYGQLLGEIHDTAFLLDSNNKPIIPIKFPFLTINNKGEFEAESINEISDEIDNQSATPSPKIKYSISFDYDFTKPDGGIQYQKQKALFIEKGEIFQEKFGSIEKQRGSVRGSHVITAEVFFKGYDTMSDNEKAIAQKETKEIRDRAIEYKVQSGVKSLLEPEDSSYGSPQSKFGRTPKEIEKSIADGVVEKENKKNVRIWNEMWKNRIYDLLESNPEMIDYIETFLELSNNDLSHPQRGGAAFTAFDPNAKGEKVEIKIKGFSYNPKTSKLEKGVIKEVIKTLEYEHAKPSNIVRKELLKEAKRLIKKGKNKTSEEKVKLKAQFGEFVDNARKNYALWAVAYNDARKLDKANLAHKMPKGETILWKRYFNKLVAKYGGIDPKKLFTIIGKEVGPSVADAFGIKNDKGELTEFGKNQLKLSKSISKAATKNNSELPKSQRLPKDSTNEQVLDKMQELDNEANEARIKYSKSQNLDEAFNDIIEAKTGIETYKRFSPAKAQVRGASKGKFNFFIPSSAEDFVGLLYKTLAKGKLGDNQMQWYKDNLLDPYARAMNDISSARVAMLNDYKQLKEDLKVIPKDLKKKSVDEYTKEQAVRVYIWNKQGNNIPGLFKTDQKELSDYVNKDPELKLFAEQLIAIQKGDVYAAPKEGWLAGSITTDFLEGLNTTKRKKYLEQWQTNVDEIFSEVNLNKLEAAFGKPYRNALENILRRMKTGRNKPFESDSLAGRFTNWLNNSVGAIMFFNTRSAALQLLSSINFVNFSDNNPLMAGVAFANQPQYWKDFKFLFNSDFLKERRGGLRFNVSESEIADMAKKAGARGVLSRILQAGFLPTQAADSFAIASGGAAFYRNRINTYIKQGLTESEAQDKAFTDFRELAEESQQSSRPDRISAQQAGPLGRTILAFANTPAQYARLTKKAASDLINGRGDAKTNITKLAYYGFVQNLIFTYLQQAVFAIAFGDSEEDEKEKEKKYLDVANSMTDGFLRGIGISGAIISTVKNALIKIVKESEKKRPDYAETTVMQLLGISPPVQSKAQKIRSALKSYEWNKKEMLEKGFSLDNPAYLAGANVISASTNLPLDRIVKKVDNIKNSTRDDITSLNRIMLLAGWSDWQLGIQKPKKEVEKKVARGSRRGTSRSNNRSSNRR